MTELDHSAVLNIVEAAYSQVEGDQAWKLALAQAAFQLVDCDDGFASFQYRWSRDPNGDFRVNEVKRVLHVGDCVRWNLDAAEAYLAMPSAIGERLIGRTHSGTANDIDPSATGRQLMRKVWSEPIADLLGIVVCEPNGYGLTLNFGGRERFVFDARTRTLLNRVAFHLAAGFRLRLKERAVPDDAEAVLTPNGKVLHATDVAKDKRELLDDGRRRRDEARKSTHDAEKALEVWRGLVAGRWSLVDHFDTDGKRFLLAMKNTPSVAGHADLTPRERRVCALVAMGHPDKETAYILGLSTSCVARSLLRARRKLGLGSRIELMQAWKTSG